MITLCSFYRVVLWCFVYLVLLLVPHTWYICICHCSVILSCVDGKQWIILLLKQLWRMISKLSISKYKKLNWKPWRHHQPFFWPSKSFIRKEHAFHENQLTMDWLFSKTNNWVMFWSNLITIVQGSISPTNGAKCKATSIWHMAEKLPLCFTNVWAEISLNNLFNNYCTNCKTLAACSKKLCAKKRI